jgi:ubiquinone/menaquinone biosynthesis C-methylase UbiE
VSSLHYVPDLEVALASARRTLEPGGTIAILERAPERSLLTRLWGTVHALVRDGAKFVSTPALHERLAAAGFEEVVAARYLERWLWNGKLITSMALSTARAPAA